MVLEAYSDSDYAGCPYTRRSVTGYVMLMGKGCVSWRARKQATVATSSTEAEYKAASDACRQLEWLRIFGDELGDNVTAPTPLCMDNQGAIFLAVNPVIDRRTKHIDIRYHFIREMVEKDAVKIFYVATEDQLADSLTKSVPRVILERFVVGSGLISS